MKYKRHYSNNSALSWMLKILIYILCLPIILVYLVVKLIIFIVSKIKESKKTKCCINTNNITPQKENESANKNKQIRLEYSFGQEKNNDTVIKEKNKKYEQKQSIVTNYEKYFYDVLERNFGNEYKVQTQVNLASVVVKTDNTKYQNELFRNIDFGIFDKTTLKPLLLIEINDSTHKNNKRYERDLKVREILQQADIKLITFYSFYDNTEEYVVNRIREELKK